MESPGSTVESHTSPVRIPFDSLTLAAVVAEAQAYVGGKVQKVWQADDLTVALAFYRDGKEAVFQISAHPVFARAHFITRRPTNAQPLPGLATALRARVDGSRVMAIKQIDLDRVIHIEFEGRDGRHTLVAEMMGKHSNIMLLDGDRRVIAAAKWVGKSKSVRPIQANRVYEPPPFTPKPSFLEATDAQSPKDYQGVSPFLGKLIEARGPNGLAEIQEAVKAERFTPVLAVGHGAYPLSVAALGVEEAPRPSISLALEQHFDTAIRDDRIHTLRESLLGQLKRVLLAREVALNELRQTADAAKRAGEVQLMGELILAYGSTLPESASTLEAEDYEGRMLSIKLDPEKTYLENAQTYFEKAKHSKAREGTVKDQMARMAEDHAAVSSLMSRIETEERFDRLEDLREEAKKKRWLHDTAVSGKKKEDRPFEGNRVRELLGPSGFTVLYGENAEANDYLLVRVAKPNDYWLHIRGSQSAHVVVVTNNHPEKVSREVLMYAAKIAVQHSPSKHSGYVPVDYTLRKYVRKPKGAAKGTALYTHEKTLHVEGD
ncbi:MAG: hypothetical protein QOJ65_2603 [Fimbriimonadaceae bacterium]|jgi:predicted ribosome quality control (RQC) complex YloA/Tae2 family protein|nr:hypothetical protein [Fimbriimonadaceae bacterium]